MARLPRLCSASDEQEHDDGSYLEVLEMPQGMEATGCVTDTGLMPIYTYECPACGNVVETLRTLHALPPLCEAHRLSTSGADLGSCPGVPMGKIPSVPARPPTVYSFHHPGGDVHMRKRGFNVTVSGKRM